MKKKIILTLWLMVYSACIYCQQSPFSIESTIKEVDTNKKLININIHPGTTWLYKDAIRFSVDHPDIQLSPWHADKETVNRYDMLYRTTKKVYEEPITISIETENTSAKTIADAHVHMAYERKGEAATELRIPLNFTDQTVQEVTVPESPSQKTKRAVQTVVTPTKPTGFSYYSNLFGSWSTQLSKLLETTDSLPIRLLLVFLLGILLSLTPCIYPMIPITVGILQAQGGKTFWRNCLLALAYTCGLGTTFALFGLAASCLGPLCGKLLMHPIFILFIVGLLVYLALSLFDWYELYTPKFLTPKAAENPNGSLLSAFIFGAASGTFASPCVSPGLALLLTLVASMGNMLMGFILLFMFGVGLSMPLLIVGTLSGSMSMMPKAGRWMVEIKKMFAFVLLAMCFYYLKNIIPWHILLWMITIYVFFVGIYYLYTAQKMQTSTLKKIHNFLAFVLIAWSVLLGTQSLQETVYGRIVAQDNLWLYNYHAALMQAKQENKKLFIDFWATYCSICIAINNKTLKHPAVVQALQTVIPLKVDGSYETNQPYQQLQEKYGIKGFPTFLLIDPETETVIKRWGSEIYSMPIEEFIKQLG